MSKRVSCGVLILLMVMSLFSGVVLAEGGERLDRPGEGAVLDRLPVGDITDTDKLPGGSLVESRVVREVTEKRSGNVKHYALDDGSFQAVIYADDVHYETASGTFEEIRVALVDEAELLDVHVPLSKAVAAEVGVLRQQLQAERLELQQETQRLEGLGQREGASRVDGTGSLEGISRSDLRRKDAGTGYFRALQMPFDVRIPKLFTDGYSMSKDADSLTFIPLGANSVIGSVYGSDTVIYEQAWQDASVELQLTTSGLKETIVAHTPLAPTTYAFEVRGALSDDLTAGRLMLEPAWLIDAAGEVRDVAMEVRQQGGRTVLELVADVEGLSFPVRIDPTVVLQQNVQDTHVGLNSNNLGGSLALFISRSGSDSSSWAETFIRFDLAGIPTNSILKADLHMYILGGSNNNLPLRIHRVTSPWTETTLTYFNRPTSTSSYITGETGPYGNESHSQELGWSILDITSYVQAWLTGTPNYGVHILTYAFGSKAYTSSESSHIEFRPRLVVNYNTAPSVPTILSPAASQVVDAAHTITWTPSTDEQTPQSGLKYQIQLSTNGGTSWTDIVPLTAAGVSSYAYNFSSIPNTTNARIRVRGYDGVLYGNWGTSSAFTIRHNTAPNKPVNTTPGGTSAANAVVLPGGASTFSWTFSDPDPGNTQSAYRSRYYLANQTLLHDTSWRTTALQSHTVASGTLPRGSVVYWNVQTRDQGGLESPVSDNRFIRINQLPTAAITAYADNQSVPDNRLTFTWAYADADGHAQTRYQVQGSTDNWATIASNTGEVSSATASHTAAFAQGEWDFRIRVFDGYEWSAWAYRTNITLPNSFEPNDTFAEAFPIQHNPTYTTLISSPTDEDFYTYTATKSGIDRIQLTVPSGVNYDVYVYDANHNMIAASVRPSGHENVLFDVQSGLTYYVQVVGAGGAYSATPYTLQLTHIGHTGSSYDTQYQYDNNGNLTGKQTTVD